MSHKLLNIESELPESIKTPKDLYSRIKSVLEGEIIHTIQDPLQHDCLSPASSIKGAYPPQCYESVSVSERRAMLLQCHLQIGLLRVTSPWLLRLMMGTGEVAS